MTLSLDPKTTVKSCLLICPVSSSTQQPLFRQPAWYAKGDSSIFQVAIGCLAKVWGQVRVKSMYYTIPHHLEAERYEVYVNRRVSGYLVPHDNIHTLVYFSEDCPVISSVPLDSHARTDPISTEWFIAALKTTDREMRKKWTQEPVGLMVKCVRKLLGYATVILGRSLTQISYRTWHVFTVQTQRDLERIVSAFHNLILSIIELLEKKKDGALPESLPAKLPVGNLYDAGTYLHRDIVQTLYRFGLQLGKYDGWLGYVSTGTLDSFRPKIFMHEVSWLQKNFQDLQRRLEGCKGRGNGSLALVRSPAFTVSHCCADTQARSTTISRFSKLAWRTSKHRFRPKSP